MSDFAHSHAGADRFERGRCGGFRHAPLPAKLLGAGALFLLCHPLGLLAGGAALWSHYRGRPFPGFDGHRGFNHRPWRRSGNVAFDEAQREAWNKLEEDAKAFDEFRRQQREAADREAFERFKTQRSAPQEPPAPTA